MENSFWILYLQSAPFRNLFRDGGITALGTDGQRTGGRAEIWNISPLDGGEGDNFFLCRHSNHSSALEKRSHTHRILLKLKGTSMETKALQEPI